MVYILSKILPVTGTCEHLLPVVFSPMDGTSQPGISTRSSGYEIRGRTNLWRIGGDIQVVCGTVFTADGKGLLSGSYDKNWDVSSLGNRRGVLTGTVANEASFPLVRSFLKSVPCAEPLHQKVR